MATATLRCATLIRQAGLATLGMLLVNVAGAQSSAPLPAATPCDASLSDRFAPRCRNEAVMPEPDDPLGSDIDVPAARGHDDLDDRPKQIETMNQQLRMERRKRDTLLHLYPDEVVHNAARVHALADTDKPIRAAETRIEGLTRERRRIAEATALYAGKPAPADLRNQLLRVDVALQQAVATLQNCREERAQVGKNYDDELVVLRKLWAAQPRASGVMARRAAAA
jgi:hypothetical protein